MILALFAGLALAHGGEDHAAPAAPASAAPSASEAELRLPTWSTEFEAVLVVPHAHPGDAVDATILLADFTTSAPIDQGTIDLKLDGPAKVEQRVAPGTPPGTWPVPLAFPAEGSYAGSLTVITPDRSDLLGLPPLPIARHDELDLVGSRWSAWVGGGLCGALAGLCVGLVLGGSARWLRGLLPLGVVVGVFTSREVAAHGGEDHEPAAAPSAPTTGLVLRLDSQFLLGVRTTRATVGPFEERIRALGTTVPPPGRSAEIHAPVTGVLTIPDTGALSPGAQVVAGQTLATIAESLGGAERSSVVQARTAAQVRLAQAESALALARRDADQAATLGDVLSGKEQLARQQALEVATQEVTQARLAVSGVAGALPTLVLKSPISGHIAAMLARPGDVVAPGDVLYRVVGEGTLWVEARVPQTLAGHLSPGAAATIETDAQPGVQLAATVLDPGLEAAPATGTLTVTLALDAAPGLVPGMSVTASIVAGAPRDALTVPDAAVVDSGGESLVFVKSGPETFEVRPVRVGPRAGDRREVLEGLAVGDRVVVEGTYTLRSLAGR